jgi:uncharacterized protein
MSYDCSKCPGYCCSYPQIALAKTDVARLARHFDIPFETAERRFTRKDYGQQWIMRRKHDEHFGKICRFFDIKKRNCSIYTARPKVCRTFPNAKKCGYWDFLTWEREQQGDDTHVAITNSGNWP